MGFRRAFAGVRVKCRTVRADLLNSPALRGTGTRKLMANGYMPRQDSGAMAWFGNFRNRLQQEPAVYKVSPGEVQAVSAAVDAFAEAYQLASAPLTRTKSAVNGKDVARIAAEQTCRPIYARIKADPTIADPDKLVAGIRPVNAARSRIGPPDSAPSICVADITSHSHILRYEQSGVVSGRKPPGAVALQVFRALGDSFDVDAADARYLGTFTRNPIEIRLDQSEDLKVACYVARWISRRGVPGPWGNVVRQRISCDIPSLGSLSKRRAA
jgi:hypothetical protein